MSFIIKDANDSGYTTYMTDSLADILGRKSHDIPYEITAIKAFIQKEYSVDVGLSMNKTQIIIVVPNGSLAATLRMRLPDIQKSARTKLRIVIRIGQF